MDPLDTASPKRWLVIGASTGAAVIALVVLAGWALSLRDLMSFVPGGSPMAAAAAVAILVGALGALAVEREHLRLARAAGIVTVLLSLLLLLDSILRSSGGPSVLRWPVANLPMLSGYPALPPMVAVSVLLAGMSLLAHRPRIRRTWTLSVMAGIAGAFALMSLLSQSVVLALGGGHESMPGTPLPASLGLLGLSVGMMIRARRSGERSALGFLAAALGIFIAVGATALQAQRGLSDANAWVVHSFEVQRSIDYLVSEVARLESSCRAFALTGRTLFLGRNAFHREEILFELERLRELTENQEEQHERIEGLEGRLETKFAQLDELVRLRIAGGDAETPGRYLSELPVSLTSGVVEVADQIKQESGRLLMERTRERLAAERNSRVIEVLSLTVALGLLGGAFRSARRSSDARFRAEAALKLTNEALDQRVRERTRELAQANDSLRLLADSIPDMVWTVAPDGTREYYNRRYYDFTGQTPAEAQVSGWEPLLHADDSRSTMLSWAIAFEAGSDFEQECRLRRRVDGAHRWHRVRVRPQRDADGRIIRWVGTASDIHDQKQATEILEQRVSQRTAELAEAQAEVAAVNRLQRAVLDGTNFAIIATNPDGLIEVFNQGAENLLGYRKQELIGRSTPRMFHDQGELVVRAGELSRQLGRVIPPGFECFVAAVREGLPEEREWTYVRKDGERIPVLLSVNALRDGAGLITGFLGIAQDLRGRRAAEAELNVSRDRVASIFNTVADGIIFHNSAGEIREWNTAAERILGASHDEMAGRTPFDSRWKSINEDGTVCRPEEHPAIVTLCHGRPVRGFVMGVLVGDGALTWILVNSEPLLGVDGHVRGAVVSFADITERKRADEQLARSERMVRTVTDGLPGMVAYWTADLRLAFANRSYCDWFGRILEEMVGARMEDLIESERRAAEEAFVRGALRGDAQEFESVHPRHDGSVVHCWNHYVPDLNDDGSGVKGFFVLISDVTERRLAERSVMESEERFRSAFAFAGIGMAIVALDGLFLKVNRSLCDIVGYSEDELLSKTFQEITLPDDLDSDLVNTEALLQGRIQSYQMEKRYRHRLGKVVWVRLTVSLVRGASGSPLQFVSQIEDITARKQIEQALSESEERTRLFAEHAPASVAMFDREMRYLVASRQWYVDYHLEGRRIIGECHYDVFPEISGEWREIHRRCQAGAVETAEADPFERGDGSKQWLRWEVRPWYDASGQVGGIVMFTQDITLRKRLEENLAQARDDALAASRLKSEFLANMSHELRTPLNGIIGMASLLVDSPLSSRQQQMGRVVLTSAEKLLIIVNDILDFSKIEAGRLRMEPTPFELRTVVQETLALLLPKAEDKGLVLSSRFDSRLDVQLMGDPGRIRQVLINLIGNALKFTPQGEVSVVVAAQEAPEGWARFRATVRDTGIGVPAEARNRLFQAFMQADGTTTRTFGGTGLGLAISRQLVELMGGEIGYAAEPEGGSAFHFDLMLPIVGRGVPSVSVQPEDTGAAVGEPGGHAVGRALSLLLAEDNEANRLVVEMMVEKLGHRVEVAANGVEALAMLARGQYDAVLMDCQMPHMDGYEATRRVRSGESGCPNPKIPIIALTAYALPEDRMRCRAAGMTDYVAKPIRPNDLREALIRAGLPAQRAAATREVPSVPATEAPRVLDTGLIEVMRSLPGRKGPFLLPELLEAFRRDEEPRFIQLGEALQQRDSRALADLCHTLAGSCAVIGAVELRGTLAGLEKAGRAGQWDAVLHQYEALQGARNRLHAAFAAYLSL
ncbi:MAG: PAS domain S-box protein [Opitutaceae bacterium]|nr:PAS domain S-box protein [Opitutaceae bacterium]